MPRPRDRAFVSDDGRTTFALVYIPAKGGVNPGQEEARAAQAALAGVTVGGSPVEVTGLDALRASAGDTEGDGTGVLLGTLLAALGALLVLIFVFRSFMAIVPLLMALVAIPTTFLLVWPVAEHHRRLGDRAVPRRADRARDRDRLRAPRRRPLARGTAAAGRDERGGGAERDAARRLRRRLQRHDRGDLAARAARRADPGPAQHRHRRPDDRARQRRRGGHAAAGRAGDDRADGSTGRATGATPAPAAAGRPGRASSSATAGLRPRPRPPCWSRSSSPRSRSSSATRAPTRSRRTGPHGSASRSCRTRASAPARSPRSTRSSAQAIPRPSRRRSPGRRRPQRGSTRRLAPRRDLARHGDPDRGRQLTGRPGDARPPPRHRTDAAGRGDDRRPGCPGRRLPRRRLQQLPAPDRPDLAPDVHPPRPRVPLADPAAQGRPPEPALRRRRLGA